MEIEFYESGSIDNEKLLYAIVVSRYNGKWVFVKHKERNTWEIPAGHREENEDINYTAERELFEETGGKEYKITYICDYSLKIKENKSYASLFFAEIEKLGELSDYEIGEIGFFDEIPENLTYPNIQPKLHNKVEEEINKFVF